MSDFGRPDFKIYDNGSPIADDVVGSVLSITVDDTLDGSALATIRLNDEKGVHSDGSKFSVGNELKIELGYVGNTAQVFIGEVTGWKGAFPRRGGQTLTVVAQDRFHRLRRNRRQKTFLEMKDSEAVQAVAQECEGISSAQVDATPIKQNSIIQLNQTDADFILERAWLFGMEVFVDGAQLVMREPKLSEAPVATLEWHKELKHFNTTVSLLKQQKQLKVSAWNFKDKVGIESIAAEGDERNMMGGTESGAKNVADLDGEFNWFATTPADTQEEVDAYAQALFKKRAERYLLGEGSCMGDNKIQRGTVIELEGLGELLTGKYYARRVLHTLLVGAEYTTSFRVIRTATRVPAEATPVSEEGENEPRPEPVALLNPDWEGPGPMSGELQGAPHQVEPEVQGSETEARSGIDAPDTDDPNDEEAPPQTQPLRLRFADENGEGFDNKPYELMVGGEMFEGTTDSDGRLEEEIPAGHEGGEVTIFMDADKSGESFNWPVSISKQD